MSADSILTTPLQKSTTGNSTVSSSNQFNNNEPVAKEQLMQDMEENKYDADTEINKSVNDIKQKNTKTQHENHNTDTKYQTEPNPIPAWLSITFRLDRFCNKEQTFTITGWINVHWKIDKCSAAKAFITPHSKEIASISKTWWKISKLAKQETTETTLKGIGGTIVNYTNNCDEKIIKVIDLRESGMTHYIPVDATEIFHCTSVQSIQHNAPPALYYNTVTHLAHIEYQITATLFEHLELCDFPFDRQFLNVKLKWNSEYYKLLNWQNIQQIENEEYKIPCEEQWWGETANNKLYKEYHNDPLKVYISEQLRSEIELLSPCSWIDFNESNCALIKLRIKRNPTNFCLTVLIPFFIIVSCSFTIFAIDSDDIADRLGVSVTILLTFTAFQNMVDEELPKSSDTEFIDKYILLAYTIQGLIIIGTCILPNIVESIIDNDEIYLWIEGVWVGLIVFIWIGSSIYYVRKAFNVLKDQEKDIHFWERRAKGEDDEWKKTVRENTKFYHFKVDSKEKEKVSGAKNVNKTHNSLQSPLLQKSKSQPYYNSTESVQ